MNESYKSIEKIIIENLKKEAKEWEKNSISGWPGDGYLSKNELKKVKNKRENLKKGYELLLQSFKLIKK